MPAAPHPTHPLLTVARGLGRQPGKQDIPNEQRPHGGWDNDVGILGPKLDRITAIKAAHLRVIHVIHRHEIPDAAIFEVEAALIDAYPGLINILDGHGSGDRGPMNHQEIN